MQVLNGPVWRMVLLLGMQQEGPINHHLVHLSKTCLMVLLCYMPSASLCWRYQFFVWSIPWVLRLIKITTIAKYAFCVHMICIIYVAAWVLFKSLHYLVILHDSKPYESKCSTFCKASLVWRRAVRLWYQYSLSWSFRAYFQVLKEPHRVTIKRIIAQRMCRVQAEVWKEELLKKRVDDLEVFANMYVGKTRWKFQLVNHTDCIGLCAEVV